MSKEKKEAKKAAKAAKKAEKKANKTGLDMESKNTLIKSIVAVVCVAALCLTTTSNIGKIAEAKVAAAEKMYGGNTETSDSADDTYSDYSDVSSDVATDGSTDVVADDGTVVADDATASDTSTTGGDSTAATPAGDSGASKGTASAGQKTPAEIINMYNTATAKAASKAVPFTKERSTVEKNYDAGIALKASKDIVYKFMGVGDANKFSKAPGEMDKGSYHKYLQASKLTAADVTSATATTNGANTVIVLKIKDGSSTVKGGKVVSSNNAPLDRSGLACGDNDKDYWDHKTAENVMSAIDEVPGCSSANISEKYSNATITAVINTSTGNLVSITAKFDFHFDLDAVMGSSGTADSSSTVIMKDFKW